MTFMSKNFNADSFMAAGILDDEKRIEKYAFVTFKKDLLVEKRAMIEEGADVSILYKFPDGTSDIIHTKYKRN